MVVKNSSVRIYQKTNYNNKKKYGADLKKYNSIFFINYHIFWPLINNTWRIINDYNEWVQWMSIMNKYNEE